MVERRRHSLPAVAELLRDLLDFGPGGHEHRHATPLTQDALHEAIVQELERLLRQDAHIGRPRGIERSGLEYLDRLEVAGIEGRIYRGGEPDEAATGSLAEGQAQLELRRRLVDLVHHQGVPRGNEAVLEPATRDPGRDDHDVPGRRLGRGFALAVHNPDLERGLQDGRRHRSDRERLAGARPRDDAEPSPGRREAPDVVAVLSGKQGVDIEAHRQLDGFASGARRGDHHDPPGGGFRGEEGVGIRGEEMVAGNSHGRNID